MGGFPTLALSFVSMSSTRLGPVGALSTPTFLPYPATIDIQGPHVSLEHVIGDRGILRERFPSQGDYSHFASSSFMSVSSKASPTDSFCSVVIGTS